MRRDLTLKIEKWIIWIAFFGILLLLRHLFPVIFLTFVLTYIGNTLVNAMTRRGLSRRTNLVIVYLSFIALVIGAAYFVVPKMFREAKQLALLYISSEEAASVAVGPELPDGDGNVIDRQARRYVDSVLMRIFGAETFRSFEHSDAYEALLTRVEDWLHKFVPKVIAGVREFVNSSLAVFLQFLLAIILSFLILWDMKSLQRGVQSLASGRTADIYAEIAPGMTAFGVMLGRAFEAQTGIAVVNAILTSIGFLVLGLPSIALLATIVFFCSYIPVVGVMLSTLPAALLALKIGGAALVGWLIVIILVVHAVEAYALNPIIYGRHMKMHPVAILAILLVSEHLLGIWGLLLGVPISAFVWTYVINGKSVGPISKTPPAAV